MTRAADLHSPVSPGEVQIGDLIGRDGSSLDYEVYRVTTDYAARIVERLERTAAYRQLALMIEPRTLHTYYLQHVFTAIMPQVFEACIAESAPHIRRPQAETAARLPDPLLAELLRSVWRNDRWTVRGPRPSLRSTIREARSSLKRLANGWYLRTVRSRGSRLRPARSAGVPRRIGVEALQGVQPTRRSDLYWFEGSGVDPARVLYYFRLRNLSLGPIDETLPRLEQRHIPWVSLSWGLIEGVAPWSPGRSNAWTRRVLRCSPAQAPASSDHEAETFVMARAARLLRDIDYWRAFYRAHRIAVDTFLLSDSDAAGITRRIAMDLEGGVTVGTQRSFYAPPVDQVHGTRPHHVHFLWGDPIHAFKPEIYDCPKTMVVAGYPFDAAFLGQQPETAEIASRLCTAGARFTVALLDNAFGDFYITRSMIVSFYRAFLTWALREGDVGLVIKPKRPFQFETLHELDGLLDEAKRTGRCVVLSQALGRFPSDASRCADLSVGLYLASAAIEAAIGGHRAVHCDLSRLRQHPFYAWGYRKVVFDDLEELVAAIQRYKHRPEDEPGLGDHTPVIDQLDPFRDGKAGARIGTYLRWLLEAFDDGLDRDGAVARAHERYAARWGADKIMPFEPIGGTGVPQEMLNEAV